MSLDHQPRARRRANGDLAYRPATARQVRTGDTIQTVYSRINFPDLTLTVDYPTFDLFDSPGVGLIERVRFTGTDSNGVHRHLGFGCSPDSRVWVVEEAPRSGDTFGALTGWRMPVDDGRPDGWIDDEGAA